MVTTMSNPAVEPPARIPSVAAAGRGMDSQRPLRLGVSAKACPAHPDGTRIHGRERAANDQYAMGDAPDSAQRIGGGCTGYLKSAEHGAGPLRPRRDRSPA